MGLILREGADVDAFKRVVLSKTNRINKCQLGCDILDFALQGKNSQEIAEALKADGMGGLHPVSSSTVSRWLRAGAVALPPSRGSPGRSRSGAAC